MSLPLGLMQLAPSCCRKEFSGEQVHVALCSYKCKPVAVDAAKRNGLLQLEQASAAAIREVSEVPALILLHKRNSNRRHLTALVARPYKLACDLGIHAMGAMALTWLEQHELRGALAKLAASAELRAAVLALESIMMQAPDSPLWGPPHDFHAALIALLRAAP